MVYNVMPGSQGTLLVMITPPLAKVLAGKGWTKNNIKDFIMENTRVPWYRHPDYWADSKEFRDKCRPLNPQDSSYVLRSTQRLPEPISVLVAGGMGTRIGLFLGGPREVVTKKVELPANWEKLVEKYKKIVPIHDMY